jgi:hypothetical protein
VSALACQCAAGTQFGCDMTIARTLLCFSGGIGGKEGPGLEEIASLCWSLTCPACCSDVSIITALSKRCKC